jgi:hypothetical protein
MGKARAGWYTLLHEFEVGWVMGAWTSVTSRELKDVTGHGHELTSPGTRK